MEEIKAWLYSTYDMFEKLQLYDYIRKTLCATETDG